jgi:hypothetical protein
MNVSISTLGSQSSFYTEMDRAFPSTYSFAEHKFVVLCSSDVHIRQVTSRFIQHKHLFYNARSHISYLNSSLFTEIFNM